MSGKGAASDFLCGESEMSRRTHDFDWSKTPVGPLEQWPLGLKTAVNIMLGSRYAMWLGWGPDFTFFYNDAYAKMTLGPKHPWALGNPASDVWSEIWDDIGPRAQSVLQEGVATWDEGLLLFLERQGYPEETYHTFSYSPLPTDDGSIGGMLCVVTEETERVIGERRLRTLRELAARTLEEAKSAEAACQNAASILGDNPKDIPFALVYLLEDDGNRVRLAGLTGVSEQMPTSPASLDFASGLGPWPFHELRRTGASCVVEDLSEKFGELKAGIWPESPQQAMVLPLAKPGQTALAGFLVAGISPRLTLDENYRGFLELVAGQIVTAVANARAYEEERKRAESLAALDRAKTAFFSNVSHEFRTPLTLMLGPIEDMLTRSCTELLPAVKGQLELVNRNGIRLLRLVNSLLDFSRIEAGRIRALYEQTDLAGFTEELASVFRAAIERAGLKFVVECQALTDPIYVDRDMWEKIVLNLLSNAFKFTFDGQISVTQRQVGHCVELSIQDTGTGIAEEHLPRLFERFHRIENAQGRTHEGSGIGLALVQELAKLHGGSIHVASQFGVGTTFTVSLPLGKAHLPHEQIRDQSRIASASTGVASYLEEALHWLPDDRPSSVPSMSMSERELAAASARAPSGGQQATNSDQRPLVLVADDNSDMRQYLHRLLAERYRVAAVPDGNAALKFARNERPDLVLSDVMMPHLDGFALIDAIRADAELSNVPVIMLSARAGEESRVEGMEAGADDYLVKPFGARELLARVGAHLQMAKLREETAMTLRRSEQRLRMALRAGQMVTWEWVPTSGELKCSENVADVVGLPVTETLESAESFRCLIHPDDRERHWNAVRRAVEAGESYACIYRMTRPNDGTTIWLEERGQVAADSGRREVVGILMDITEQMKTQQALQHRERFLDAIIETTPECIKVVSPDGAVRQMNSAGLAMVEADAASVVTGASVYNLIAPEFRESFRAFHEKVCAGEAGVLEFDIIGLEGTRRHLQTHAVPLENSDGEMLHLALTRDVSKQRQTEQSLRQERDLLRVTLASIGDAVITTDVDLRIINMNRVAEALTGWTADEAEGMILEEVFRIVDGETGEPGENPARRALSEGTVTTLSSNSLLIRKDHRELPIEDSGAPIRGDNDEVVGSVLVFRDVTARRQAEVALRESEEHFRTMANNAPAMLWVTEPDGACSFLSRGWYEYTGQTSDEGLGDGGFGWLQAVHPEDREASAQIFRDANERQDSFSLDYRLRRFDGQYRWSIDAGRPRFGKDGGFLGFVGSVIDVHERKLAEEFRSGQVRILEMITSEKPLGEILTELVLFIESQIAGALGSILLLDADGKHLRHGAAPNLPHEYNDAIDGVTVGPNVGSCGTAIARGQTVVVDDIQTDPLWADFKSLAGQHNLRACWSQPIRASSGELLGTTAIYFSHKRAPTPEELTALGATAHFVGIAIERPRAQEALRESEERFRAITHATSDVVYSMNADWTVMRQLDGRQFIADTINPTHDWLHVYIPESDRAKVLESANNAIRDKSVFELEHRVNRIDGSIGWTYSRAVPILGKDGGILEWFGVASDVTKRKETEDRLRKHHDELSRFNRVAVGRELRMIELKREINELCQRLDEPRRFSLHFDSTVD